MRAAFSLAAVGALVAGCTSDDRPEPAGGRIPYTASQTAQYFSAEQIARLAACTNIATVSAPLAMSAVSCELAGDTVVVAVFPRSSPNRDRYVKSIRRAGGDLAVRVGPYWVASSPDASRSELARFAARPSE